MIGVAGTTLKPVGLSINLHIRLDGRLSLKSILAIQQVSGYNECDLAIGLLFVIF